MSVRGNIAPTGLNPTDKRERLPTGLEGQNIPDDFYIPPCGIEDIDRAIFNLFDKEIEFAIANKGETVRVPTVFATGERFALLKRNQPIRDENDALILPLISIRRTSIDQAPTYEKLADVGDLVIRKRLSERDPVYQNLVNPQNLLNQDDARSEKHDINEDDPRSTLPGTVNSRRLAPNPVIGGPMISNNLKGKHIYEVITIPFPHFINVTYEVVFWTSYTLHMNQMIEKFVSSYTGTRNQFKIESDKGYWFVAYPDNTLSNRDNFEDFADSERIVRYAFNMTVPGYIVAPESPGSMRPFRKFVSAPDINFGVFTANAPIVNHPEGLPNPTGDIDKFILNDVNEIDAAGNIIDDERFSYLKAKTAVKNPFTGDDEVEYLKILTTNQRKGETVVSARIVTKIDDLQG